MAAAASSSHQGPADGPGSPVGRTPLTTDPSTSSSASASASASASGSHRSSFSESTNSDFGDAGPPSTASTGGVLGGGLDTSTAASTPAGTGSSSASSKAPPSSVRVAEQGPFSGGPMLGAPPLAATGSGGPGGPSHFRRPHAISKHQQHIYQSHAAELAAYISSVFLPSVLPTAEEYQAKEQTRQYLETLAVKVSPGARLLPFGSIASGLALRNSDMDLCCLVEKGENNEERSPPELVETLGSLIQQETAFNVKMLPKARIPIIKLSLAPSLGQPFGLACDIGFENRLALENTRLLLTYAMVDPRMRTMVLFIKVWTKRRKINDPYLGTLSSYGYVLLVIYYLINVRRTPVLPNLQTLPMPRPMSQDELEYQGHQIYFFDDLDALPQFWSSVNRENVAELLIDFFRYFASSFRYGFDVVSIRTPGGLVSKEEKGWLHDFIEGDGGPGRGYMRVDLNRLCIEDPFQTNYNVARTVTRDGLFTIRGEFMRAARILLLRTDRIDMMIRELCEERQGGVLMAPPQNTSRRRSTPHYHRDASPLPSIPRHHGAPQHSLNDFRAWHQATMGMHMGPNTAPAVAQGPYPSLPFSQRQSPPRRQSSLEPSTSPIPEDDFPHRFPQPPSPDPGYPQLTTSIMQDHMFRQGAAATDARPRYPPESVASEPPPLEHDRDWSRDASRDGGIPSSSSASSSAGPVASAGFANRFLHHTAQEQNRYRLPATAPASPESVSPTSTSPPRTRNVDAGARSSSHSVVVGRRNRPAPDPARSSIFINGRSMPDFSKLPTGPIRFGDFGSDGITVTDASPSTQRPTSSSPAGVGKGTKGLGVNGVPPSSADGPSIFGSPTTPKATVPGKTTGAMADIGVLPRTPGSPAQLSRKIVFGDVEISAESLREAREQALAALLRKRRPPIQLGGINAAGSGNAPPKTPPRAAARHRRAPSQLDLGSAPTTAAGAQITFGTAPRLNGVGSGSNDSAASSSP